MSRPNIVLIIADQLNTRHLGCYGGPDPTNPNNGPIHTPTLDSLAAGGTVFERAYCQSPICMPSRAAFNTGFYPHSCRALHNPVVLEPEFPTIAEYLSDAGYTTAGFGHLGGDGIERGFQTKVDLVDSPIREAYLAEQRYLRGLGSEHSAGYSDAHPFPEEDIQDHRTTGLACSWLESLSRSGSHASGGMGASKHLPFYLQVDFMNPHIPLLAPKRCIDLYHIDDIPLPPSLRDELSGKPGNVGGTRQATRTDGYSDEDMRRSILHYRALVSYVDELTGRIIDSIDRIGALDDTIMMFFSDHGDYIGEFGLVGKTGNFYDCLTNVPLIVSGPGELVTDQRTVSLAGLVDIPPTILEATGVAPNEPMQGRSFLPALSGNDEGRNIPGRVMGRYAFCETRGHVGPISPPIRTADEFPAERLKPLPTDPYSSGPVSHMYDGMMVRDERYKLSVYGDGFRELYDLENDPWERLNLAFESNGRNEPGTPKGVEERLLSILARWQMECWRVERPQSPLPYHYRATAAELIPEQYRDTHRRWRPAGD
jgi:arylsulfatase A-like enzyme